MLPRIVEGRCLFLDADTLVVGDVNKLMDTDLKGCPLGACVDNPFTHHLPRLLDRRVSDLFRPKRNQRIRTQELQYYISLGFFPDAGRPYFNAGVMVMDCTAIRKLFPNHEYLSMAGARPFFDYLPEQDRLNQLLRNSVLHLPLRWNISPYSDYNFKRIKIKDRRSLAPVLEQIGAANDDPGIWHFNGGAKPWMREKTSPYSTVQNEKAFHDYDLFLKEFESLTGLTNAVTNH